MSKATIKQVTDSFIWAPFALTGKQLRPQKNILLEIKEGMIVSMHSQAEPVLPEWQESIPLYKLPSGSTLLPSLIDAHVHLVLSGDASFNRVAPLEVDRATLQQRIDENLLRNLESGIGALRDGGDRHGKNLSIKKDCGRNLKVYPQIIATGEALRKVDNYGVFLGQGYTNREQVELLIRTQQAAGIDQLKVIASGIVNFDTYGQVSGFVPSLEELAHIVRCAHQRKMRVMAHASSIEAVDTAVQAGVDSIEHGYFITKEILKKMVDRGIAWVPTIIPVAAQMWRAQRCLWNKKQLDIIKKICEGQMEKVLLASQLGVCLGIGTDAGAPAVKHGINLVEEMFLYAESTLNNRTILKAAAVDNARILGIEERIGAIEPGYRAQLIAVHGNPLSDLSVLRNIAIHFLPNQPM